MRSRTNRSIRSPVVGLVVSICIVALFPQLDARAAALDFDPSQVARTCRKLIAVGSDLVNRREFGFDREVAVWQLQDAADTIKNAAIAEFYKKKIEMYSYPIFKYREMRESTVAEYIYVRCQLEMLQPYPEKHDRILVASFLQCQRDSPNQSALQHCTRVKAMREYAEMLKLFSQDPQAAVVRKLFALD